MLTLTTPQATATLTPYGAQLLSFTPNGAGDLLWQTTPAFLHSALANGKPQRGGIPLCWPWFMQHATSPKAPNHGFARISTWKIEATTADSATLTLTTDGSLPYFPHKTKATLTAALQGAALHLTLATTNLDTHPFYLTQALHTYLRVGSIHTATVEGLPATPQTPTFPLTAETDLVLSGIAQPLKLVDPTLNLTVQLQLEGTDQVVIWNPWTDKSRTLDMPPEGYEQFLCLEAARVAPPHTLSPGASTSIGLRLSLL